MQRKIQLLIILYVYGSSCNISLLDTQRTKELIQHRERFYSGATTLQSGNTQSFH